MVPLPYPEGLLSRRALRPCPGLVSPSSHHCRASGSDSFEVSRENHRWPGRGNGRGPYSALAARPLCQSRMRSLGFACEPAPGNEPTILPGGRLTHPEQPWPVGLGAPHPSKRNEKGFEPGAPHYNLHMKRTNLVLDEDLLEEAVRVLGTKTYSATVNLALKEALRMRRIQGLANHIGKVEWLGDLPEIRSDSRRPPATDR